MAEPEKKRNVLLYLAAEGVIPVLGGCAGALAGGPVAGIAGVAVGHAVEKAINLFGKGIVERWQVWFARHPAEAQAAVAEMAALPPAEIRKEAKSIFLDLAPDAAAADLNLALDFLSAIPRAVDRALVPAPTGGGRSLPPSVALDDPRSLLQLLPEDVPPYPSSADLPGTPYRLVELLGSGGFGTVYRAVSATLQHLPLAIKFCLDRALLPALNQERSNLERLMRAGGRGSAHVVRLYGYDLDHPTPYLVYEYVDGGDLTRLVAARRAAADGPPHPAEVLGWIVQIAEGLAFAHRTGLVHRDLKPANVLVSAGSQDSPDGTSSPGTGKVELRLADFGLGGVSAARAVARSRIGASTIDYLSLAEQASLFRGAGTPLYMSPEQRRGAAPDPRHDLYALGVMWFQLLTGDVSRELHHGWAKELTLRFRVPADHIALIERCVGWFDERPKDAGALLPLLLEAAGRSPTPVPPPEAVGITPFTPASASVLPGPNASAETGLNATQVTPVPRPGSGVGEGRRRGVLASLSRLTEAYTNLDELRRWRFGITLVCGFVLGLIVGWLIGEFTYAVQFRAYFPAILHGSYFDWLSVTVGILSGLVVWGGYAAAIRLRVKLFVEQDREKVEGLVREIASDFPTEVETWGGRAVLRHPETVRRILKELSPSELQPPSPTSILAPNDVTNDPTRKAILIARLQEHDKVLDTTNDAVAGSWVAMFVFCLPVAIGSAVGVGQITQFESKNNGLAFMFAIITGGVVAWLSWWGMAAIRRNYRRKMVEAGNNLAADYPPLVSQWGGRRVLDSRETLAALIKTYTPEAWSTKGGWFRRLFGG
jgi:serine/threonine protein kinase